MHILLVEDEQDQREIIADILEAEGYAVEQADCVEQAILTLKSCISENQLPDVIFSDWKLGNLTGLNLLDYVKTNRLQLGFVVATAYGSIGHAVEAMKHGADDYLSKPFRSQELLLAINKANTANNLRLQNTRLTAQLSEQQNLVDLVGNAPCMQKVYERIKRVSNTVATVLITGESGTGKELAARALHQLSDRNSANFIAINCGAIPESLAEAELFGAEKGAYTGADERKIGKLESANEGTLFLDEIGELPLALQAKLLRFLQEGVITRLGSNQEVSLNVRIIAATHRDIPELISNSQFRQDLYYRLNVVPLEMPALRDRKEDIPKLIYHFIDKYQKQYGTGVAKLSADTKKSLCDHPWPGNVRELSNRLERYVLLGDETELSQDLNKDKTPFQPTSEFVLPENGLNWMTFEKHCLHQALQMSDGNKTKAAKLLGLNYKQFLYRLDKS